MNLTIAEFLSALNAHKLLDHALPSLSLEKLYWTQWKFDDSGAHYIQPLLRNDMNHGSARFELLERADPLMSWIPEGMRQELGPMMKENKWGTAHDYEQELDGEAERLAHEDGTCGGMLFCGWCLDDWEEANREQLDKMGYYDSKGRWTT